MIKILLFHMSQHDASEIAKALDLQPEEVVATNDVAMVAENLKISPPKMTVIPYGVDGGKFLAEIASKHKASFIAIVYQGRKRSEICQVVREVSLLGPRAVVTDDLFSDEEKSSHVFKEITRLMKMALG